MSAENIINNSPKEFTEPCFACGVSEFQLGVKHAEERIIKLLEPEVARHYQLGLDASAAYLEQKIALIKDETRNITSEILPDGTIYIEEVKGEQK